MLMLNTPLGRVSFFHSLPSLAECLPLFIIVSHRRRGGDKRKFKVLEDNDPTGFKSGKAKAAKKALHIEAVPFPRFSPDLNPLDFCIWAEIERRMAKNCPSKVAPL
jgi:hypothetical protein